METKKMLNALKVLKESESCTSTGENIINLFNI